jgi:hypothetical protein
MADHNDLRDDETWALIVDEVRDCHCEECEENRAIPKTIAWNVAQEYPPKDEGDRLGMMEPKQLYRVTIQHFGLTKEATYQQIVFLATDSHNPVAMARDLYNSDWWESASIANIENVGLLYAIDAPFKPIEVDY